MPLQVTESEWADLEGRISTLESGQKMIASGHVQLVEQMAEITVSQRKADAQRKLYSQRLDSITAELADNSRVTREILQATTDLRDVVTTARTGGQFVKWLAPTLVAAGAALLILKGWWLSTMQWFQK
jgi:hypothetical protein